jgi:hypothetical protein
MAHRNRMHSILARSFAVAGVATFLVSAPAQSQFLGGNLREANAIAQLLADAETARLNGNCTQRDAKLTEAETPRAKFFPRRGMPIFSCVSAKPGPACVRRR